MAASVMSSLSLKPSPFLEKSSAVKGIPSLARPTSSFKVQASGVKKIKTDRPYGTGGGMSLRNGLDASGRKPKGKGVYQFTDKYGANVDGYSPIYSPDEWSPTGDVYVGGTTGLLIWAVTLGALLLGGALLVYNTSALSQ
ncbi:photosystem II 10 kDa polypeptide, chloroplastic-like [Magnolia sinica]|uniref:photosystem II 10 kDa polypeptide, chloroplastic-like n=1 Tax=Magnolia sinica TaxID=86752 RepID=UPI002659E0ED|nr:photosystem II 10 kDa polypeptide, chloroplastic-like [Magnolia sinica]